MSVNRENVVWQSKDGSWNRGFFAFENINENSEDFDYEWDVEYDYEHFWWASTGHRTETQATNSWRGANPSIREVSHYSDDSKEDNDNYDRMAEWLKNPAAEAKFIKEETIRKNKIHFENLVELMDEMRNFVGLEVYVSVAQDDESIHSGLGSFYEYVGRMVEEDDKVGVRDKGIFHELYNKETKTFIKKVRTIEERKRYGYSGGYNFAW